MAVLEAAGSGAAPVLVAAYNHFAVEFLLLLLESIFDLLPFQSSIPGERVISERLQAGRQHLHLGVVRASQNSSWCHTLPGHTCPQRASLSYLVLPGAAPMALHCAQNSNSARNMSYSSRATGDCLPAS